MAMVNWQKKLSKHCSGDLAADEEFLVGTYVEPPGVLGRTVAFGAVGGAAGLALGNKLNQKQNEAAEAAGSTQGIADRIPKNKGVLGLTGRRLLMFSQSSLSGRPKQLVFETGRENIAAVNYEAKKLLGRIEISFVDGSAIRFEGAKAGDPEGFARALGAQV